MNATAALKKAYPEVRAVTVTHTFPDKVGVFVEGMCNIEGQLYSWAVDCGEVVMVELCSMTALPMAMWQRGRYTR